MTTTFADMPMPEPVGRKVRLLQRLTNKIEEMVRCGRLTDTAAPSDYAWIVRALSAISEAGDITEAEILSAASAISRGRQKRQNGGRKPKLSNTTRLDAKMRLAAGESVNSVAKSYGVSWATIRRLKP